MKPLGKTQLEEIADRAEEIAAAKAVIEARIRLAQLGVTRNKIGRYGPRGFVPRDKTN